jgi:N-acetylmuramoyl-L-alanine amidase
MILRRGSSGVLVRNLQQALNVSPVSGTFGPVTEEAVRQYQRTNGLKVDGVAGPKTLGHILNRQRSVFTESIKEVVDKIKPLHTPTATIEDKDDPEEIGNLDSTIEEAKICPFEEELMLLISGIKLTRRIDTVFVHCTATNQNATVSSIQRYWRETLKWNSPGYHILITADGGFTYLQDFNSPTNGVAGHNARSLHISYIGGIDRNGRPMDNRTEDQKRILERAISEIQKLVSGIKIRGHNEVSKKACPSFNVLTEYTHLLK